MMRRTIARVALAFTALAPVACATEGGLGPGGVDLFDAPQAPAVLPADAAASGASDATTAELASLQSNAEDAYRARRLDEAIALYERLLERRPSNAQAWLRLGNVHHRRRDWFKALAAYRRAAARAIDGVEIDPAIRAKAIYNIALIDLELARRGLRTLERLGPAAAAAIGDASPLAREVERTQRSLDAISSSRAPSSDSRGASAADDARGTAATQRAAKPRRAPDRNASDAPRVDYIRGEPRP